MIVGPIQAQMDDFCDLHGTPDTPVSRIVTVKDTLFFEKKSHSVHKCKPHEAWFCAARFFLEPKTVYLEALLY